MNFPANPTCRGVQSYFTTVAFKDGQPCPTSDTCAVPNVPMYSEMNALSMQSWLVSTPNRMPFRLFGLHGSLLAHDLATDAFDMV